MTPTTALFFPFDLFGSSGCAAGVDLLADALDEVLADNRREQVPTRAGAYQDRLRLRRLTFETLAEVNDWRKRGRREARQLLRRGDFFFWIAGNHLGVLPLYEELAAQAPTLVVQFDAHLDVHHFHDCTSELSHGNFVRHIEGSAPELWNVGHRELLLRPEDVRPYFARTFPAADLAVDSGPAVRQLRQAARSAARVLIDIDCDVLDAAHFPAVTNPVPLGLSPATLVQLIEAVWSDRLVGVAVSEFCPAHDRDDRSLATLVWLLEYWLIKRYEA